jgi:hypothetical protein
MSDSGEDQEPQKSPRKGVSEEKPHWGGSFFSFLAAHPSLPQTLSYYAQFIFNVFLLCCCGYLIYCFWSAVLSDVDKKSHEAMADIVAEIRWCEQEYKKNNCNAEKRLPFVESHCNQMEKCMSDPRKVGRAKVSAYAFAEIFNSFVEPISYKAMIFSAVMIFGCFGISNFVCFAPHSCVLENNSADSIYLQAFGYFRRQPTYGYGYPYGPPPTPTPQRSFSNQDGGFYTGTPWHQPPPGMGFEPQPSGGFGQIDGQGSPQRRLVYS